MGMRTRETERIIDHVGWQNWQRQVRLGETSLGLEEWYLRRTQEGPADPPTPYTLDEQRLRDHYVGWQADDMPVLWAESPARAIEEVVSICDQFITGGPGPILIYPLIYDGDTDGILISFGAPDLAPRVVGPMDWDDVAGRWFDESLTVEQIIAIVNNVIREANRGLALA